MTVTRTTRLDIYRWSEDLDAFTRSQMDTSHENLESKVAIFLSGTSLPTPAEEHERSFFYKTDDEVIYYFDGTDASGNWVPLGQFGTVGQMATLAYGDSDSAGVINAAARIDHKHELPEVDLTNYVTKSTLLNKGDLFVATSPSVVGNLGVGADGAVLTTDSSTSTGLKWQAIDISSLVPRSTVDAKGDLLVGTNNDVVDNLPVGTNGQMLVANSASASGLMWSGGPTMQAFYEKVRSHGTVTSNLGVGDTYNVEALTLGANISLTLYAGDLTPGTTGSSYALTLIVTNDATAGRVLSFPPSVKWPNGLRPNEDRAASRTNVWSLISYDGGATWFGFLSGRGFS